MKRLFILLIVLLLAGGAAWWFRDSIPFLDRGERVEVSPEAAADAEAKLARMRTDGQPIRLSSVELSSLLPDSARVEVAGSVRSLGAGRAAMEVRQVEFAGIPIPERYYPPMLERIGQQDEPDLTSTEMGLKLPPGVSEVRVENGYLLLIP